MSKDLVVIDNAIVKASYTLSVNEQRLILTALAQIPKETPIDPGQLFYIRREDFIKLGSHVDNVARDIRTAIEELEDKCIVVDTPIGRRSFGWLEDSFIYDANGEKKLREKYPREEDYQHHIQKLKEYNLLVDENKFKNDKSIVAYICFDYKLMPFLSDLRANFTKFFLNDVVDFTSSYSYRIYQMMMQFKGTGYLIVSLDELRYSLALTDKYPQVGDLKRFVIDISLKEISKKSPYKATYSLKKTGRTYTHLEIKFKAKKKTEDGNGYLPDDLEENHCEISATENSPQIITEPPKKHLEQQALPNQQHNLNFENNVIPTANKPIIENEIYSQPLSDAQIKKLAIYKKDFIDVNSSRISPTYRGDYDELFNSWKPMLQDAEGVLTFKKVREFLNRTA